MAKQTNTMRNGKLHYRYNRSCILHNLPHNMAILPELQLTVSEIPFWDSSSTQTSYAYTRYLRLQWRFFDVHGDKPEILTREAKNLEANDLTRISGLGG